jgi:hypothetical protein
MPLLDVSVVGSQTNKLIFFHFLGHNLCFRSWNGECNPTWDVKFLRPFQGSKEGLIWTSFVIQKLSQKFGTLWGSNLQNENPLGSAGFIHLQHLWTCFENWDTPLTHSPNHALTLVMNPKLELQQSQCIGLNNPSKRFSFVSLSLCTIFHAKRFTWDRGVLNLYLNMLWVLWLCLLHHFKSSFKNEMPTFCHIMSIFNMSYSTSIID